jgi:hypothetical protein
VLTMCLNSYMSNFIINNSKYTLSIKYPQGNENKHHDDRIKYADRILDL